MNEIERDRLKEKLEQRLAAAIATEQLLPEWRKDHGPVPDDVDYQNTEMSLLVTETGVRAFKVRFRSLSGSFELLTLYPIDLDEADQTLTDAIENWWLKYRFLLLDYWNACHPEKYTSHPEEWGRSDDQR